MTIIALQLVSFIENLTDTYHVHTFDLGHLHIRDSSLSPSKRNLQSFVAIKVTNISTRLIGIMKMIAAILVLAFLALSGATNAMTVYEKLRQKKLNKFIGLIDMLDLDYGFQTLLDDPKFKGTVFAITDKAADAMEASVQDMGGLADLLNYHIIPSKRLKTKDMPKGVKAWDSQLIGHQVLTEIKGKVRRIIDEKKNKVKIYKRNLRADKAVIHVLTQDLKPKI